MRPFHCASDRALFAEQTRAIDACFDAYIPPGKPVALLQFPWDGNVGNHMMWIAIADYLARRKIPIGYAAHKLNFNRDEMLRAIGDGVIMFLGGVTVSRLWPHHADLKRVVAASCPNNRLISLPSTMLFVDDEDRKSAGDIFGDHADVIVMARDPVSASAARGAFPENVKVVTVHDSTFRMRPQPRASAPQHDIIWLARDDMESTGYPMPSEVQVFDWPWLDASASWSMRFSGVFSRLRSSKSGSALCRFVNPPISALYRLVADRVVRRGNLILDTGRVLVTDRLHPHVLAALRGQPVVMLPERYGKNRAVYDYSSHAYSMVRWADTPAQAIELARSLLRDAS